MKRIMIAVAVVAMAIASQAASFNWSASGVKTYEGSANYAGVATIYAYASSDTTKTIMFSTTADMLNGAIAKTISSDDFSAGTKYKFYYTLTDTDGNTFKSSTKTATANATVSQAISFGSSGSWTAAPEPTSAVLLLLGVAGLALRRKQK